MYKLVFSIFLLFLSINLSAEKVKVDESLDLQGDFIYLEGTVLIRYEDEKEWRIATLDMVLEEGTTIKLEKDSFAEIKLSDNTTIELNEESMLKIAEKSSRSKLDVFYGSLRSKVKNLSHEHLQIRTPVAVASVRGTDFSVIHEDEKSAEFEVFEGEVGIVNDNFDNKKELIVKKNEVARSTLNENPVIIGDISETRLVRWQHLRNKKEIFLKSRRLRFLNFKESSLKKKLALTADPEKFKLIENELAKISKIRFGTKTDLTQRKNSFVELRKKYTAIRSAKIKRRHLLMKRRLKEANKRKLQHFKKRLNRKKNKGRLKQRLRNKSK